MRFQIFGSSSSGNCAILETEQTRILVDAGFSGRKIESFLRANALEVSDVEAVFLTHEHGDHIAGIRGLARHSHLEFYATHGTATATQKTASKDLKWKIFESGCTFRFRDLEVTALKIPHDAYDPVGFVFRTGGDSLFNPLQTIVWLTDLGYVPEGTAEIVRHADVLILESNHDLEMLEQDPHRPFSLKQRIRGRHGHLSNDAARMFLDQIGESRWSHVLLGHLSKDCNTPEKVHASICPDQRRFTTTIIDPQAGPGAWIQLNGHA